MATSFSIYQHWEAVPPVLFRVHNAMHWKGYSWNKRFSVFIKK